MNPTDWLSRLRHIFRRPHANGVLVLVNQARDEALREVFVALLPEHPDLKIFLGVAQLITATRGDIAVFIPEPSDATWLNIHRPFFAEQKLRILLWTTEDLTLLLRREATDFFDWISHLIDCPQSPPKEETTAPQLNEKKLLKLFAHDPIAQRLRQKGDPLPLSWASHLLSSLLAGRSGQAPLDPQRALRLALLTRLSPENFARLLRALALSLGYPDDRLASRLEELETSLQRDPLLPEPSPDESSQPPKIKGLPEANRLLLRALHDIDAPPENSPNTLISDELPLIKKAGSFQAFLILLEALRANLGAEYPETRAAQQELAQVRASLPGLLLASQESLRGRIPLLMLLSFFIENKLEEREAHTSTDAKTIFWSPEDLIRGEAHFRATLYHHLLHAASLHPIQGLQREPSTWQQATETIVRQGLERAAFVSSVSFPLRLTEQSAEELYLSLPRAASTQDNPSCLRRPEDPAAVERFWREKVALVARFFTEEPFPEWLALAQQIAEGKETQARLPDDPFSGYALLFSLVVVAQTTAQALASFEWVVDHAPLAKTQFFGNSLMSKMRQRNLQGSLAMLIQKSPKIRKVLAEYQRLMNLSGGASER